MGYLAIRGETDSQSSAASERAALVSEGLLAPLGGDVFITAAVRSVLHVETVVELQSIEVGTNVDGFCCSLLSGSRAECSFGWPSAPDWTSARAVEVPATSSESFSDGPAAALRSQHSGWRA